MKRKRSYSGGQQVKRYKGGSYVVRAPNQGAIIANQIMANKAAARARRASRMAAYQETKYVDGTHIGTVHALSSNNSDTWSATLADPSDITGAYGCMPVPKTGDGYYNRDGRKIFMKKIYIRGKLIWGFNDSVAASAMRHGIVRIVMLKDSRTNGATVSPPNIIGNGVGGDDLPLTSGVDNAINFPTNPDGWGRYTILKDKVYRPPTTAAYGDYNANTGNTISIELPFKMKIRCNCFVNFKGNSGRVADIVDNSFHMLAAASEGTVVGISYYARTVFGG